MKFLKIAVIMLVVLTLIGCSQNKDNAVVETQKLGEAITLTEVTPLADLMATPADFVGKEVLVEGSVNGGCQHSHCWISLDLGNDERLIVAAEDKTFIFPDGVVGKTARIQGMLTVLEPAEHEHKDGEEHSDHEGGEAGHECPAPTYVFAPKGLEI
jgi:Domain of unknown function (DUF4920)